MQVSFSFALWFSSTVESGYWTSKEPSASCKAGIRVWEGRSTAEHSEAFEHMFFSSASVVRNFPSCALDFSHSSSEISTWGLPTRRSALGFSTHHRGWLQLWDICCLSVFLAWVLLPHLLAFCLYSFPVFHGCNIWTFPFNSSPSSGKHSISLAPRVLVLTPLLPSCDPGSLNHGAPKHGPFIFSFARFWSSSVLTLF